MNRDGFIFYKSFYDSIKELSPEDQVQIYNAIFTYQFEGEKIELKGICKSIFTLIIPQLEANNNRYKNGCKGGRPKNQNITKLKPMVIENENQNITKPKPKEKDKEKEKEKEKDIYYSDKKLNDLFEEFLQVRKKLKAINSERAIQMLMKKLNNYDDDTKYKIIEQSIVHSWKDVYELKNKINSKEQLPEWYGKNISKKEMSEGEVAELKDMLKEFN